MTWKYASPIEYLRAAASASCIWSSCRFAIFPAILGLTLRLTNDEEDYLRYILPQKEVYINLCTLVSLCLVFHVIQAYTRFMTGVTLVYTLMGDLVDACGELGAFTKASDSTMEQKKEFMGTLVRLTSMLFALCCADIEDTPHDQKLAHGHEMIDPEGLDQLTLSNVHEAIDRPGYLYQCILNLVLDACKTKVLDCPPPLLTRCFQELGNGMIKFHECLKFRESPFPFGFKVVTDMLICLYTLYTPFMFATWASGPVSAFFFSYAAVGSVLMLHYLAAELDNPFGQDSDDLQSAKLCKDLNMKLMGIAQHLDAPAPHLANKVTVINCHCPNRASSYKNVQAIIQNAISAAEAKGGTVSLKSASTWNDIKVIAETANRASHRSNGEEARIAEKMVNDHRIAPDLELGTSNCQVQQIPLPGPNTVSQVLVPSDAGSRQRDHTTSMPDVGSRREDQTVSSNSAVRNAQSPTEGKPCLSPPRITPTEQTEQSDLVVL